MDAELRGDGADPPVLGVVQTTDFGDDLGSEHGGSRFLPDRTGRSRGSHGCTPRSAKAVSGQSGRHRRSPRGAARRESAPRGLAAALAIASQDCTAAWKTDPLRRPTGGPAGGGLDTLAGGGHCPPAHEVSADGGAWPPGTARAGLPGCTPASRIGTHGRSCSRWRRADRSAGSGAGAGPELRAQASQPPALGGWTNAARLCEAPTVRVGPRLTSSVRAAERRESPGSYRGFRFSTQLGKAYPRLSPPPPRPHTPTRRATRGMMLLRQPST